MYSDPTGHYNLDVGSNLLGRVSRLGMSFLGIEIGGTKLQLGVGRGDGGAMLALERYDVQPRRGAAGILADIEAAAGVLISRHQVSSIGIGFGGPCDTVNGITTKSHQIDGWDGFPLVDWCRQKLDLPARIENDCDAAALAEARFGAGRGKRVVFYVTVGTGIGGGLVIDGRIYRGSGRGAAEIGHLRPGLHADRPDQTIESLASGWGIAATAQARIADPISHPFVPLTSGLMTTKAEEVRQRLIETEEADEEYAADLLNRCEGRVDNLTTKMVAQAARDGNDIAREVMTHAAQTLGWGIAQMITLLSPDVVVVGGGVAMADELVFMSPLIEAVGRYVFPPFAGSYDIVPAALGELVVVHGAMAVAGQK